ncbi:RecQ helicase TLH3 [Fusarium oxysporum f. sp. albedinis]|nr:RecQ helicase TLH3 [Fusarium oxysporum f. sp. albedinis]
MCPTAYRFHRKDHYVHCSKVAGFHKDDWSLSSLDQIFARNPQKSVSPQSAVKETVVDIPISPVLSSNAHDRVQ